MKVSKDWLKSLVSITDMDEVVRLIPLRIQGGTKELTERSIELDLKGYNRADLLSMRGVAHEIAAITDTKVTFSEPNDSDYSWVEKSLNKPPVSIESSQLATLQCVAKIEGLKVAKSPDEWIEKLNDSGMRSVNNIADITNLVMLEYGHPLHAFDSATIKDDTINVRVAKEGEEITTLDGKLRKLTNSDIVLADSDKALDVAGVMGGKDTEIKDSTSTILLSASLFNPEMIRQTSQRLKLTSEASKRFYHGLTKKRLLQALDASIRMYQEIGGKLTGLTIVGDTTDQLRKIPLSSKKMIDLIGVEITKDQVEEYLSKLQFELSLQEDTAGEPAWVVTPPYYQLDIEIEEDVIEEIARMYGYEKIAAKQLQGEMPEKIDQSAFELRTKLKQALFELGLTEIQTYSYYSTAVLEMLGFTDEFKKILVKVSNPISKETEYLRQNIWPNLAEVSARNLKFRDEVAIFEIGKVFELKDGIINEQYRLSIVLSNNTDQPITELHAITKELLNKLNLKIDLKPQETVGIAKTLFHPKRFISASMKDQQLGGMAEVHPKILDNIGLQRRLAIVEITLDQLKLS